MGRRRPAARAARPRLPAEALKTARPEAREAGARRRGGGGVDRVSRGAPDDGWREAAAIWYRIGTLHQEAGCARGGPGRLLPVREPRRRRRPRGARSAAGCRNRSRRSGNSPPCSTSWPSGSGSTRMRPRQGDEVRGRDRAAEDHARRAGPPDRGGHREPARDVGRPAAGRAAQAAEGGHAQAVLGRPAAAAVPATSYIVEEILYRKARESKLIEDPEVRAQLRERRAQPAGPAGSWRPSWRGRINITDGDLVDLLRGPQEQATSSPQRRAEPHRGGRRGGGEGGDRARSWPAGTSRPWPRSSRSTRRPRTRAGRSPRRLAQGQPVPGLAVPPEALAAVFEAEGRATFSTRPLKSEAGYHVIQVRDRKDERQQPFEEVRAAGLPRAAQPRRSARCRSSCWRPCATSTTW